MPSKDILADILKGDAPILSKNFKHLPLANKLIELEKAVVQPKKTDTPTLLNYVVSQLVRNGAIYPEEASAVYSRLLDRVVKFNSIRNHNSLESLVNDIQQGQKSVVMQSLSSSKSMSNLVVLQAFLQRLPKTVSKGQQNYESFKGLLKQFVIDYNQFIEVFRSGPDTFLQYNFGPAVQKINLTQAFNNLNNIWGAIVRSENEIPSLTALLQPQTRYLILLLSPIAIEQYFLRDSFIWYMFKLYKNTVVPPMSSEPVEELGNVIASLGPSYDQLKLKQGLNYLVTNQQMEYKPKVPDLTKEEEALLRYVQTLLRTKAVNGSRQIKQADLDNVIQNLNPSAFQGNIDFLNRLFDFFSKILQLRPELMTRIIFDSEWKLPPAFFLKKVLTPQDLDSFPPPRPIPDPNINPGVVESQPSVPVPAPRRQRPRSTASPMPLPRNVYRERTSFFSDTDTDTETDLDALPVLRRRRVAADRNPVDVDNLTSAFNRLSGRGLESLLLRSIRSRARNINVRPY
ncbi:pIIIa protein [Chinstrap penguin adenovirus 2]|uniref:PIIIa protein n=1 Tax=Chinstrap penguin adenovirus 2 TaxID=1434088 RepID=A0A161CG26_9ADEN|nr:pIIIa protein [Chinstrap penguin adenovirus 2]ALB78141.1 pIIIa protein [Chinstrap penguin adenovirus 2]